MNVVSINNGTFKNCTALKEITIPQSVTTINKNAFANLIDLTIYGVEGTTAETFANEQGFKFVARTVPAEKIVLSETNLVMVKGETCNLWIKEVTPMNVTDKVVWSSSDEKVVTVSKDGFVNCKKAGKAEIIATVGNISVSCEVEVVLPVTELFTDVAAGSWYADEVQYVYNSGLMFGTGDKFNPSKAVTRAQLITTLYRLAGSPEVTDYSACDKFSDVKAGAYYADAVCWAYTEGITTGNPSTGKFNTTGTLMRQQLAAFLRRYAEYRGYDTSVRGDISNMLNHEQVSDYAVEDIKWAVGTGLISGSKITDDNGNEQYDLAPKNGTTRAQLAAILMRFCETYQ